MCRSNSSTVEQEHEEEYPLISAARVERLETLIRLRKLYRNLLRADRLLAQPSPVYQRSGAILGLLLMCHYVGDTGSNCVHKLSDIES